MFSLYLGGIGSEGMMILGGYDKDHLDAQIQKIENQPLRLTSNLKSYGLHWINLNSKYYWQVNLYSA